MSYNGAQGKLSSRASRSALLSFVNVIELAVEKWALLIEE
jgi:hypothetical protein